MRAPKTKQRKLYLVPECLDEESLVTIKEGSHARLRQLLTGRGYIVTFPGSFGGEKKLCCLGVVGQRQKALKQWHDVEQLLRGAHDQFSTSRSAKRRASRRASADATEDNDAAGCHMSRRQRGRLEASGAQEQIKDLSAQLMAKLGIHVAGTSAVAGELDSAAAETATATTAAAAAAAGGRGRVSRWDRDVSTSTPGTSSDISMADVHQPSAPPTAPPLSGASSQGSMTAALPLPPSVAAPAPLNQQAHSGGQNTLLRCQHEHQPLEAATAAASGLDRAVPGGGVAPSTSPPPLLQASQQQQLVPSSHVTPLTATHTSVAMQHALRSDTPVAPLQQLTGQNQPDSLAALTATATAPLSAKAAATAAAAALLRRRFAPHSTSAAGGAGPSGHPAPHRQLFAAPSDQMPQQEGQHPAAAAAAAPAAGATLAAGTHAVTGVRTAAGAYAEFPAHNSRSTQAAAPATAAAATAGGGGRSVGITMGCGTRDRVVSEGADALLGEQEMQQLMDAKTPEEQLSEQDKFIAHVLRHIKQEAHTSSIAEGSSSSAAGGSQQALPAVQQQQQQQHLGLQLGSRGSQLVMEGLDGQQLAGLPNPEQLEYYVLADVAFDSAALVQLYQHHLCPYVGEVHMGGTLRSGNIRESVRAAVVRGRVQQHHPELASPLAELAAQVPELQCVGSFSKSSTPLVVQQTDAAERLLLCLRCLDKWDTHVHLGQQQQLPQLLRQLLLSGVSAGQQDDDEGDVAEVIDLAQADTDQELTHELLASGEDVLLVGENLPQQQRQQQQQDSQATAPGVTPKVKVKLEQQK